MSQSALNRDLQIKVASLHGGISNQPAHVRHDHQVEDATNVAFSVADGASKRPGTVFDRVITGLTAGGNYRLHKIERDENEKYLVLYGEGVLRVFDLINITEATVNVDADAQTYLDLNSPESDDMRLVSIADFTIIVNKTVTVTTEEGVVGFTVTDTFDTWTKMTSQLAEPGAFYQTTETDGIHQAGFYEYLPVAADNGYPNWNLASSVSSNWKSPGGHWDKASFQPWGVRMRFRRQDATNAVLVYDHTGGGDGEKSLALAGAFASYTFTAGDEVHITATGGDSLPEGWHAIASKVDDDTILLTGTYRDTSDASQSTPAVDRADSDSDYISVSGEASDDFFASAATDMDDVAERLMEDIRTESGLANVLISWQPIGTGGYFQVVAPYHGTESDIIGFYPPDAGGDLTSEGASPEPFDFSDGTVTAGTGTPTETVAIEDRWQQVPAPGENDTEFDADTMPVQMVRTTTTPLVFTVSQIDWKPRLSGNHDSNPAPSFAVHLDGSPAGHAISDIAFHRNRLVITADETIVFSQAGDLFNFFIEDVANLSDSDPIDISLSSDEITLIDWVVPFRKSLLIFTKAGRQFDLNAPEAFTPNTVSITPSTTYNTVPVVEPKRLGEMLYFITNDEDSAHLMEYFYDDSRVNNTATDVTAHAHRLVPDTVQRIETNTLNNIVWVRTLDCHRLYVYRSHWVGNEKKQSAWSKWLWDDTYRIVDIAAISDNCQLYLLVESPGDQYNLEYLNCVFPSGPAPTDCFGFGGTGSSESGNGGGDSDSSSSSSGSNGNGSESSSGNGSGNGSESSSSASEDAGDSGPLPASCPCDQTEWNALVETGASCGDFQFRIGITPFDVNDPPFAICNGCTPDWPPPAGDGPHVMWNGKMGARVNQCQWVDTNLKAGFPAPSMEKHSYLDSPVVPGVKNEIHALLRLGTLNWWLWIQCEHGAGGATLAIYAKSVGAIPTGTYSKVDPSDFSVETDGVVPNESHCTDESYDAQPDSITLAWTT